MRCPLFLLCLLGSLMADIQGLTQPMPVMLEVQLGKERFTKFYLGKDVDYETAEQIEKQKELLMTLLRQKESLLPLPSTGHEIQPAFHFSEVPAEIFNGVLSSVIPSDFVLLSNGAVLVLKDLRFTTPVRGNYYLTITVKKPLQGPYSNLTVKFYRNGKAVTPTTAEEEGVIDAELITEDGAADDDYFLQNVEITLP